MDTLICILFSLHAVVSGGTYYMAQLNNDAVLYSTQINDIVNDPDLLNAILLEYEPLVSTILIPDNLGG